MVWIQFAHPSTCRDIVVIVTFIDVAQMLLKQYSNVVQYIHALQYNLMTDKESKIMILYRADLS
jgi:hypothetical protein